MGEKKFLIAGGITLALIFGCILFLLLPTINRGKQTEDEGQQVKQEEEISTGDELSAEERDRLERAEAEIARFKETYDMDISIEDMVYQLEIRDAYEKMYGKSYALEDVFIIGDSDSEAGDPPDDESDEGDEASMSTSELLQAYIEKYGIDETRFQGMTPEQELEAIKVEYGSLNDETDSAYYTGESDEADSVSEDVGEENELTTEDSPEEDNEEE